MITWAPNTTRRRAPIASSSSTTAKSCGWMSTRAPRESCAFPSNLPVGAETALLLTRSCCRTTSWPRENRGTVTMRILIVEDEPTLGQQLKSTLEQNGYAVDLSTDGE